MTGIDLDRAVDEARARYAAARPISASWSERAARVLPGGNTRSILHFEPFPFRVDRAAGKHLWDVDGHRYVDLLGNYTAGLLGHSPAPVLAAAKEALSSGWSLGAVHEDEVRLAELLVERFPSLEQVRFTNSGTEANLMALAAATHHTGRRRILVFRNGYHGGVLTFGRDDDPVNVPHDWLLCDYNDIDGMEQVFARHGSEIACALVEPMQGSGGCIPADPEFLRALQQQCRDAEALLVFDEVMTSRFSAGGAQQLLGITPDLTTLGKYLAGGLTFGAFGGRADVMAHFDAGQGGRLGHAGTFNNNVASMAGGVAALTELLHPPVLDALHARGDALRVALNDAFSAAGLPLCATGSGSLMNVHGTAGPVASARDLRGADDRWKELFFFHCLEADFYVARRGFIALSIEITDGDVGAFLDAVGRFDPVGARNGRP
ncbi:aspartate aminotransferase family protein [Acidimicrobiia bacterium EGI L10123]|uniref:aspartate aminotransferase family protein n=1 Tax=Salinilacustrithrix flava TaxID=2957203 RepID=UPI003D7C2F4C|nr:aspartate aminotransferase family protein [Acidimicrobiia bacterium EGI L10123]